MRRLTFVRKMPEHMGKYVAKISEAREILKTSLLYYDHKTQVPREVIELLQLKPGKSKIVWVAEGGKIHVESAKQKKT